MTYLRQRSMASYQPFLPIIEAISWASVSPIDRTMNPMTTNPMTVSTGDASYSEVR